MQENYPAARARAGRNQRQDASASPPGAGLPPAPILIDSKTAAKRLTIDVDTVRRLARKGLITGYRIGQSIWRFDLASVDAYLASCRIRPDDKRSPLRDDDDPVYSEGAGRARAKGARHA